VREFKFNELNALIGITKFGPGEWTRFVTRKLLSALYPEMTGARRAEDTSETTVMHDD
jgi:hypothetical protein